MKIVFTICSLNYLAQAKTLGDSLASSNPEVEFRIYVVDKIGDEGEVVSSINYHVIEIEKVDIPPFAEMVNKYDIIELNTAVKPFIIQQIFEEKSNIEYVIYFDPDIKVYSSLENIFIRLEKESILLTPHSLSSSDYHTFGQPEVNYLSTGIFNLGFIALRKGPETAKIVQWWKEKVKDQGFNDHSMHLFYDQKWMNLAPVFFEGVVIEKSPCYNMAGWNLHERILSVKDGKYLVNGNPLVFYHFSGVDIQGQDVSKYSKYSFENRPDLVTIITDYRIEVMRNEYLTFKTIPCYYTHNEPSDKPESLIIKKSLAKKVLSKAGRTYPKLFR